MKFTHTVLTSRVMDAAEEMYKDITITADHRQQIEHAACVACMNEDTAAARLADFRRVLKLHHVSPEDIAPTDPAEAAQAAPAAPQVDPITAAMVASIGAPAPAQTVTVTWANGTRATYSANMLDLLKTDPAALDIQDDTTGELVYIKPDTTPTEEAPQAAPATPEQPTTDEQKEEENPMSITPAERIQACNIIIRRGGYRERDLLTRPHEITRGETWNAEHKVVNVTETTPDPDGYRPGCAVDLVTRSIVG